MNWTKIVTVLIYVMAPATAFGLQYRGAALIAVLCAILLVIGRDAEYRVGAVNPKAHDADFLSTLKHNVECVHLEGCYVTMVSTGKSLRYAVMRPHQVTPVATGESLAEAAANAVQAFAQE